MFYDSVRLKGPHSTRVVDPGRSCLNATTLNIVTSRVWRLNGRLQSTRRWQGHLKLTAREPIFTFYMEAHSTHVTHTDERI